MTKISTTQGEKTAGFSPPAMARRRVLSRSQVAQSLRQSRPTPPPQADRVSLPTARLESLLESYQLDCRARRLSVATRESKKVYLDGLLWYARQNELPAIGATEIKQFLIYLAESHTDPGGRWGDKPCGSPAQKRKPLSSETIKTYHAHIRAFCNWLVAEGTLDTAPTDRVSAPVSRPDQVVPFTADQVTALHRAAGRSAYPERDTAIILTLLNTGIRASELCALTWNDLDLQAGLITIEEGKGGKLRQVPLSNAPAKALYAYRTYVAGSLDTDGVFVSERGRGDGSALTRSGLAQLIRRLASKAAVSGKKISPHTFRHTFAVNYLRPKERGGYGGDVFGLKRILGHTRLDMTDRYVNLAGADITDKHRDFDLLKSIRQKK